MITEKTEKMWCSQCRVQRDVLVAPRISRCLQCGSGRVHHLAQTERERLVREAVLRRAVAEATAELRAIGVAKP
jgi:hypothetical protein